MAMVRIEVDRGDGWRLRAEGEATVTAAELLAGLPDDATQYPHRAFLDGALVGEIKPKRGGRLPSRG